MKKIALVLMGGGRLGAFEAGVCFVLSKLGFFKRVSFIVGTSAGGLNAIFISKYRSQVKKVVDMWLSFKKNTDVYKGKIDVWGLIRCYFSKGKSVLNPQGLYKVLNDNFRGMKLKDLPIPVCLTGTNLTKQKKEIYFPEQSKEYDLLDMAKVTSAIPGIFPCQEFDGVVKCDGGVLNNLPIETAIKLGATHIIAIRCSPANVPFTIFKNTAVNAVMNLIKTLLKFPETEMFEDIEKDYPNIKILTISPDKDLGDALNFEKGITKETVDAGLKIGQEQLSIEILNKFYNS